MPATFEIKSNNDNEYYFSLLDNQGNLLMMSGEFPEKEAAVQAINEVKVGSLMSDQIAAGQTSGGETFFVIKDRSGNILVKSILFNTRMLFDNALHAVKDNACIAETSDLT